MELINSTIKNNALEVILECKNMLANQEKKHFLIQDDFIKMLEQFSRLLNQKLIKETMRNILKNDQKIITKIMAAVDVSSSQYYEEMLDEFLECPDAAVTTTKLKVLQSALNRKMIEQCIQDDLYQKFNETLEQLAKPTTLRKKSVSFSRKCMKVLAIASVVLFLGFDGNLKAEPSSNLLDNFVHGNYEQMKQAKKKLLFNSENILVYIQKLDTKKSENYLPKLIEIIKKDDPTTRDIAISIIGNLGTKAGKAVPFFRELLKSRKSVNKWNAAWVLSNISQGDNETVDALVASLGDEDSRVVTNSAMALGIYGPKAKKALPKLNERLAEFESGNYSYETIESIEILRTSIKNISNHETNNKQHIAFLNIQIRNEDPVLNKEKALKERSRKVQELKPPRMNLCMCSVESA